MLASACLMLGARAVHADIQTPVADILTILQTGLTGDSFDGHDLGAREGSPCTHTWCMPKNTICQALRLHHKLNDCAGGIAFYYYSASSQKGSEAWNGLKVVMASPLHSHPQKWKTTIRHLHVLCQSLERRA